MKVRDLHHSVKASPAINPAAAITGNGDTNSAWIDTQGFGSTEFVFQSGVITDGTFATKLQDADAANQSDVADVAAAGLLGSAPAFAVDDDNKAKRVGYIGTKRYVRAVVTQAGATSGGFLAATCVQGHPWSMPVA